MESQKGQKVSSWHCQINNQIFIESEDSFCTYSCMARHEEIAKSMQVDFNLTEGTKHAAEDGLEESPFALSSTNSFLLK